MFKARKLSSPLDQRKATKTTCHRKKQRSVFVAKDSGLISDKAYHELRMSITEYARAMIPPINVLKDERNRQNKNVEIH